MFVRPFAVRNCSQHSFTYVLTLSMICRSLSIVPTVAVYNNRAQAEIKLQQWHRALQDCQRVLELEPLNLKGAFESCPSNVSVYSKATHCYWYSSSDIILSFHSCIAERC